MCSLLDEAVEAYQRRDLEGVYNALNNARAVETEHGDSPATNWLASSLLAATAATA